MTGPPARAKSIKLSLFLSGRYDVHSCGIYALLSFGRAAMLKADETLQKFNALNVWKRGAVRAPHKPLLVLLALGRLQAGANRLVTFDEIEEPLTKLLQDFGPPRRSPHPELPFFHLQSDGVWEIEDRVPLRTRQGSKNPLKSELRAFRIAGGFPNHLYTFLQKRPEMVRQIASQILHNHFPDSLHESIAAAANVSIDGIERSKRDPAFRSAVIAAWGHQCAFCGFNVQLDGADLALEAAHIRWCQSGGPDVLSNGLACCSIHHKAFDRGAMTISDDRHILVSSRLHGSGRLDETFFSLHGKSLATPARRIALPNPAFVAWHRHEVFRGEARD